MKDMAGSSCAWSGAMGKRNCPECIFIEGDEMQDTENDLGGFEGTVMMDIFLYDGRKK